MTQLSMQQLQWLQAEVARVRQLGMERCELLDELCTDDPFLQRLIGPGWQLRTWLNGGAVYAEARSADGRWIVVAGRLGLGGSSGYHAFLGSPNRAPGCFVLEGDFSCSALTPRDAIYGVLGRQAPRDAGLQ